MSDKYVPTELRRLVQARARGLCEYCRSQQRFSPQLFSIEHIIAFVLGGLTIAENLAQACQGCNGHKFTKVGSVDPVTGQIVALFHPRQQRWRDHFAWTDDAKYIVGLTPTGRATIEALQMNRVELVNLREVLFATQNHPPVEPEDE
jgi:5-methylcytosine-specific restriction endonuclease McrA